jgi:hypothetical protein
MQVQVAIGANHHFEVREALLVYRENHTSFITKHEAIAHRDAPPTLGPAQPLTDAFVESLVRSLGGSIAAEVLPENILSKGDRMEQPSPQNEESVLADLPPISLYREIGAGRTSQL